MGCSSAGYLGGKFARKPGPIVGLVDVSRDGDSKTGVLRVWGANLSVGAGVFVNRKRVDPAVVVSGERSDGDTNFTDVLRIAEEALPVPLADVTSIVIVNGDSQEARWAPPEGTTGIPGPQASG
jgi:hypothetical protein